MQKVYDPATIFVLSDATGETGELLVRAVAAQFEKTNFDIKLKNNLSSVIEVEEALTHAALLKAAVFYTIARGDLLKYLKKRATELNLINVDIIRPLISSLHKLTGEKPLSKHNPSKKIHPQKTGAIEFAVKFDDGKDPRGLSSAEVIVIGVSRTSKTPLCMYLACQDVKAVNIPLVLGALPPEELFHPELRHKVVGLDIKPEKLQEIRKQRLQIMGLPPTTDYASMDRILAEQEYSYSIMHKIGCPIIDITNRAIEETAANIIKIFRKRKE